MTNFISIVFKVTINYYAAFLPSKYALPYTVVCLVLFSSPGEFQRCPTKDLSLETLRFYDEDDYEKEITK